MCSGIGFHFSLTLTTHVRIIRLNYWVVYKMFCNLANWEEFLLTFVLRAKGLGSILGSCDLLLS